jgi:hypothetical protein
MKIKYFILVYLFAGCGVLRQYSEQAKSFTNCYDERYTGLDTLINIKGYFAKKGVNGNIDDLNKNGDLLSPIFFFNDGFFTCDFYLIGFLKNVELKKTTAFSSGWDWGIYTIHGDTIKLQYLSYPGGMSWDNGEIWFKILNKNKLQPLTLSHNYNITVNDIKSGITKDSSSTFIFTPLNILPDPNLCWLKNEKWAWCNPQKYKIWKKGK